VVEDHKVQDQVLKDLKVVKDLEVLKVVKD